jgi:hypothetical protein
MFERNALWRKNMLIADLRLRLKTKRHNAEFKTWWAPQVAHQVIIIIKKETKPFLNLGERPPSTN